VTAAELRTTVPRSLHFVTGDVIFQVSARAGTTSTCSRLTKDDFFALLPHLGDKSLAREEDAGEANLDVAERAKLAEDVLGRDAERAQALSKMVRVLLSGRRATGERRAV
jgi:hypothetical protein